MNSIHDGIAAGFERIAHISLQAAVLVAVVLVVQRLLRPWLAPRWRHALWLVVVARLLLPVVPESPHSLYNWLPAMPEARVELAAAPAAPTQTAYTPSYTPPAPVQVPAEGFSSTPAPMPVEVQRAPAPTPIDNSEPGLAVPWLAWGWLLGTAVMLGALVAANARLSRMVRHGRVVDDARVLAVLADCATRAGVSRPFTVLSLEGPCTPALVGHLRPRIILPESLLATAGEEQLRHIFLHELAHWKRRDIPLNWLTALLLVVHWFNPALWLGWRRMRLDRELACDALALSWADPGEARAYGRTILSLLDRGASMRALPGAVGIFESNAGLKGRIASIARFSPKANRWSLLFLVVVALLAYVGLTDAQQQGQETEDASTELVDAALREKDANNLKQLGIVLQLYVPEQRGGVYPPLDGDGCRLTLSREAIYPEYLTDPSILVSPWVDMPPDADAADYFERSSYWYMPYAVMQEATALIAIEMIRKACVEGSDLPLVPEEPTGGQFAIVLLRNGFERMFITSTLVPDAEAKVRAKVPVLIGQPVTFSDGTAGGHVLYMDGSVKFHPYPGDFPMTESVVSALAAMHPPAMAPVDNHLPEWAVETLWQTVSVDAEGKHIAEILDDLSEQTGARFVVDWLVIPRPEDRASRQAHVSGVTLEAVRLDKALETILPPLGLDYSLEDGYFMVSSPAMFEGYGMRARIGTTSSAPIAVDSGTLQAAMMSHADDYQRLRLFGVALRSYSREQEGNAFPPLEGDGCRLAPSEEHLRDHMARASMLSSYGFPYGRENHSSYLPYAVSNEDMLLRVLDTIRDACEQGTALPERIPWDGAGPPGLDHIPLAYDGVAELFITDPTMANALRDAHRRVPIMISRPQAYPDGRTGGHVLYLDGSVRFHPYPGGFPMTERVIEALTAFDPPEGEKEMDAHAADPAG